MQERVPSLRSIVTMAMVGLATLTLAVSASLMVLTTYLHEASTRLGAALESVRLAQDMEIDLLVYERATDPLVISAMRNNFMRQLPEIERQVTTAEQGELVARTRREIGDYIAARERRHAGIDAVTMHHLERAYHSLEELVEVNRAQARDAQEHAASWNRTADLVGVGATMLLLLGVGLFLWWLQTRAFLPLFGLASAMHRYGSGSREVRALPEGPSELQKMAHNFNQMASAISQQNERQLATVAGIAHDLRNPLQAIRLSLEMATAECKPDDAVTSAIFGRIGRQIDRLDRMVGDFLDTARLQTGRLELHLESRDLRDVAREAVDLFRNVSSHHDVHLSAPDVPVVVRCDAVRLGQVMNNLLSNAIKYSPNGGDVRVEVRVEGNEARITVLDKGIGVPDEKKEEVFEPFRRCGREGSDIPGVGLGLYVSRRLVEAHGGAIDLESIDGEGSQFFVRLPLRESAANRVQ